jgi:SNF2 family DNA or RNA helicase
MKFKPYPYQDHTINKILELPKVGLFLDMGLGKTVCTLTAIDELMFDSFEVSKVLVIAPKRVAEDTWLREIEKWDHLKHLKISKVLGTQKQRIDALKAVADIYVINRENVVWLVDLYKNSWPYDTVVIDELSSFKSNKSQRFKELKKVTPLINRMVGLTGTPTPNGYLDLWPQMYLLDRGERLGKTIGGYRDRYFAPGRRNGYTVFDWDLKEGAEKAIQNKIKDICISMDAKDYLDLPERINNNVYVTMEPKAKMLYEELEKELILQVDGEEVTALTAATLTNKLLQMANGSVYNSERDVIHIHDGKLEALEDILEFNQEPVLVFYNFKHDYNRMMKYFKGLNPRTLEASKDIADWNDGKIRLLLAHPASVGHGLNIQAGGHIIVWFGLTWSLELYQQANARLDRQGQTMNVIVHHLITEGTVDEDVMKALDRKEAGQAALLEAVKARMEEYRR